MEGPIEDRLTVIITSSPVRSNPDTHVISSVFKSFQLVPGLAACRKILICDGYLVVNSSRYKRGQITECEVKNYEEFKRSIQTLADGGKGGFENTMVVAFKEREGFGWAVKFGCELATTPYVLIVQHDRVFMRGIDVIEILDSMDMCPEVRYVGLRTSNTKHFTPPVHIKGKINVYRMSFWYDSTHVCRTSFYRSLFQQRFCHYIPKTSEMCTELVSTMTLGSKKPHCIIRRLHTHIVKRGMFIEDTFGQLMMTHINFFQRNRGDAAADRVHDMYGAWLLSTEEEANIVGHLNGRDYLTSCQLVERGYVPGGLTTRLKSVRKVAVEGDDALLLPHWAMHHREEASPEWGARLMLFAQGDDNDGNNDDDGEEQEDKEQQQQQEEGMAKVESMNDSRGQGEQEQEGGVMTTEGLKGGKAATTGEGEEPPPREAAAGEAAVAGQQQQRININNHGNGNVSLEPCAPLLRAS